MKTRKVLSLILALAMLLTAVPVAFAADGPTITVGTSAITSGVTEANVIVNASSFSTIPTTGLKLEFTLASGLTLKSATLSAAATTAGLSADISGLVNGIVTLMPDSSHMVTGVNIPDGELLTLGITVDANATGTLNISLSDNQENYQYYSNPSEFATGNIGNVAVVSGSVTIGSNDPYTAKLTTTSTDVTVGETVAVSVNVGGKNGSFASSEVKLTYDPAYLKLMGEANTYATEHTLNGAGMSVSDNTITIVDHGDAQDNGVAYVINFEAVAATAADATTPVTLTSAGFSVAADAVGQNLTPATEINALNITVNEKLYNVALPEGFVGEETVVAGATYEFTADETGKYYENYDVTAQYTDGTTATVTGDLENGWSIENVNGDLTITVKRDAKKFTVTAAGATEGVEYTTQATYGEKYTFTVKAGAAATDTENGHYYVATATIGTKTVATVTGSATKVVTGEIAGADITGNITITVTEEPISSENASFTITGEAKDELSAKDVNGNPISGTVKKGTEVILVLNPKAGYDYTVTVNGGEPLVFTNNECNIGQVNAATTVSVTKAVNKDSVKVYDYLTLNGTKMWLVTVGSSTLKTGLETDGNVYTYTVGEEAGNMFWSSKYNAYCYLVVASTLGDEAAKNAVSIDAGTATAIAYDMNVNLSTNASNEAVVDANDAQLIYNMYQTKAYNDFTTVSMRKFLEADLNAKIENEALTNYGINVDDAQVVVDARLTASN